MRRLSSLLLFCCMASAQSKQPPAATTDEPTTFKTDTNWVLLPVSVSDKNGKLVTDLQQKSFKVLENGVEQPIKLFKHEDVPISLGIIVDNSGSMKEKRQKVKDRKRESGFEVALGWLWGGFGVALGSLECGLR